MLDVPMADLASQIATLNERLQGRLDWTREEWILQTWTPSRSFLAVC